MKRLRNLVDGGERRRTGDNAVMGAGLGRRERNKLEKRARIVAAARALFAEKGFSDATTQEIAERADIGSGTLFLYARSKEDLLVMVFRDEMIETSQAAFTAPKPFDSLLDHLMHIFGMMVAYHDRDADMARVLLKEIMFPTTVERREDLTALMQVIYGGIANLIAHEQAAGRVRGEVNAFQAAQNLFAVYYHGLMIWLGGIRTRAWLMIHLRESLAMAIQGLATPMTLE